MILSRRARIALAGAMVVGLAIIYVPLLLVLLNSLNSSRTFGFPPSGLTLEWWRRTLDNAGARSALWCQTLADVLGCTIRQAEEPVLANARGAALIAAVAIGDLAWSDIPSRVHIAASYHPDPERRTTYDRQYRTFTALYRKTRRLYLRHNRR